MMLWVWMSAFTGANAPPTGFTTAVERVALVRTGGAQRLTVDALLRVLVLEGARPLASAPSQLCPTTTSKGTSVIFTCTTRRLWAQLAEDEAGLYLDLRSLRGVTWTWEVEQRPLAGWSLSSVHLPDTCPGVSVAAQAECALAKGSFFEAEALYTEALNTPDAHLARLRLGDFALLRGDPESALGWYSKVSAAGPVGRLAALRLCDLTGNCLQQKPALVAGLPPELECEARFHLIRNELAIGREHEAMAQLHHTLETGSALCETMRGFCQKAVAAGLASADERAVSLALGVFATAGLAQGPFGLEASLAAATAAEKQGAPGFAAAVLAHVSGEVPKVDLGRHLQHVTRLYLAANDFGRAAYILDYASERLPAETVRGGSWNALRRQLTRNRPDTARRTPRDPQLESLSDDVELSTTLAKAVRAVSTARTSAVEGASP